MCAEQEQWGWPTQDAGSNVLYHQKVQSEQNTNTVFVLINSNLLECAPDLSWESVFHITFVSQALGLVYEELQMAIVLPGADGG